MRSQRSEGAREGQREVESGRQEVRARKALRASSVSTIVTATGWGTSGRPSMPAVEAAAGRPGQMRMSQCRTEEKAGHAGLAFANKIRENLVQSFRHMRR